MRLSLQTNFPVVDRMLGRLSDEVASKALPSATNKTMAQASTMMRREITREFNVKGDYVRDRLRVKRAVYRRGVFAVEAELIGGDGKRRSANLIRFLERQTTLAQARSRAKKGTLDQLHFQIRKAGGKQIVRGAFIGNKGRTVFIREGKARTPIKPVRTIDVSQMFNAKRINTKVLEFIRAKFPQVFESEVRHFTRRFNDGR